jgi:hypothetical protein
MSVKTGLYTRTPLFIGIIHLGVSVLALLLIQSIYSVVEIKLNEEYIIKKLASSQVKLDESKDSQGFLTSQTNTIQYAKNNLNRKIEGEIVYDFSALESAKENQTTTYTPSLVTSKKSNLQLWFACLFQKEATSCFKIEL